MKQTAIIKAAYYMCRALDIPPSRRNVDAVIRKQTGGMSFRPQTIAAVLKTLVGNHLGTTAEPPREPPAVLETRRPGTTPGTPSEPSTVRDRDNYVPSTPVLRTSVDGSPGLFPTATTEPSKPKRRRREKPPADTSWIETLLVPLRLLKSVELRHLTAEERFSVARMHCLKFANCCADEATNRQKAIGVASSLADVAEHRTYGAWTVGEYVDSMQFAWEAGGKKPLLTPWAVRMGAQSAAG